MTTALVAAALAIVFCYPMYAPVILRQPNRDIFTPGRIAGAIAFASVVPYLIWVAIDPSVVAPQVRYHDKVPDVQAAIIRYGVVHAIGFIALLIGIAAPFGKQWAARVPLMGSEERPATVRKATTYALAIGLVLVAGLMLSVGGVGYVLRNLHLRGDLFAGKGYFFSAANTLVLFGCVGIVYTSRYRPEGRKRLILAALAFFTGATVLSLFGGRKPTIVLLVMSVIAWHYAVARVRHVLRKLALVSVFLIPYFVVMPLLRVPNAIDFFARYKVQLARQLTSHIGLVVTQLSYVDHYILITSYFTPDNIWWGKSFRDLAVAPIPRSLYPGKPPVDEGRYIITIAHGRDVAPSMPASQLMQSSWPPETLGAGFMNFWYFGAILFMFILGLVYRVSYEYMVRGKYTLFGVTMYGYTMLNFQISNIRIVQFAIAAAVCTIYYYFWLAKRRAVPAAETRAVLA